MLIKINKELKEKVSRTVIITDEAFRQKRRANTFQKSRRSDIRQFHSTAKYGA
jgi:hypothetical protein